MAQSVPYHVVGTSCGITKCGSPQVHPNSGCHIWRIHGPQGCVVFSFFQCNSPLGRAGRSCSCNCNYPIYRMSFIHRGDQTEFRRRFKRKIKYPKHPDKQPPEKNLAGIFCPQSDLGENQNHIPCHPFLHPFRSFLNDDGGPVSDR